METLEILKNPATLLVSGLLSILWSVLASLLTPYLVRKYKERKGPQHHPVAKAVEKIKEATVFKNNVLSLQKSPSLRTERKLDAIHKQLTGIFLYLLSFTFMWLGSSFEPAWLLIVAAIFIFFLGTDQIDKGVKLFGVTTLATKRLVELEELKDLSEDAHNQKMKELNLRDFGLE